MLPATPKQALSMLKQASSTTNVSERQYYLGSQLTDSPQNLRKGSVYNLKVDESSTPVRKGSVYTLSATDNLASRQRKGSMYVSSGISSGVTPAGSNNTGLMVPDTLRKNSMIAPTTPESPSMSRKSSVIPSNSSAKTFKSLSDSSSNLSTTVSSSLSGISTSYGLQLGPGQIHPKGYRLTTERHGELKMGFSKIKGTVEVEVIWLKSYKNLHEIYVILHFPTQVICARKIVPVDCETPPDTYVKCYIKDGDRLRHKKKTRVVRHSAEPIYKQTIKYQVCSICCDLQRGM